MREAKNDSIPQDRIITYEPLRVDTVTGDYHIRYLRQTNDEYLIPDHDSCYYFASNELLLSIRYRQGEWIERRITLSTLADYIPAEEQKKHHFYSCHIERVSDVGVTFSINACVPDTDLCYLFDITVAKNGAMTIEPIEDIWESDAEE